MYFFLYTFKKEEEGSKYDRVLVEECARCTLVRVKPHPQWRRDSGQRTWGCPVLGTQWHSVCPTIRDCDHGLHTCNFFPAALCTEKQGTACFSSSPYWKYAYFLMVSQCLWLWGTCTSDSSGKLPHRHSSHTFQWRMRRSQLKFFTGILHSDHLTPSSFSFCLCARIV